MKLAALLIAKLLVATSCVAIGTTGPNAYPSEGRSDRPEDRPIDRPEDTPDVRVPTTTYADWLNVGGSHGVHPSGVAAHIRKKGIRDTIVDRAELTREVLGPAMGSGGPPKLGVWMPFGVRRDLYGGKLRFFYNPHPDLGVDWEEQLVAGIRTARQRHGVEVVLYLGKVSNCSPDEFDRVLALLNRAGCKTVIIDNLSDTKDRAAPALVARIRRAGLTIGSEFPEKQPVLADFGFAVDMTVHPTTGAKQGAHQAQAGGLIPNGQPLSILLKAGWPGGMPARIRHWQRMSEELTLYANLSNSDTLAAVTAELRD